MEKMGERGRGAWVRGCLLCSAVGIGLQRSNGTNGGWWFERSYFGNWKNAEDLPWLEHFWSL